MKTLKSKIFIVIAICIAVLFLTSCKSTCHGKFVVNVEDNKEIQYTYK